nr:hypothetical protein [uncultured Rhodopila sp.]
MVETGILAIRHAVEDASNEPIGDAGIMAILRGEGGVPSHLRAGFGDVSLASILNAGASGGVSRPAILDAHRAARDSVAAANPEREAALKEDW